MNTTKECGTNVPPCYIKHSEQIAAEDIKHDSKPDPVVLPDQVLITSLPHSIYIDAEENEAYSDKLDSPNKRKP